MQTKFDETEYSALLERIFAITPSVQTAGFTSGSYKPGLEGMQAFDERLGHPWKQYRCIHVAGTNGKGSVASMLAAALSAGGAKVGLYTSPHLVDFRERMKVISDNGWCMPAKEEVWDFFQSFDIQGLSFFEITTGLAFLWFARQRVDWAVIETGLGGRLDSTNIITPELSVITSIGLDHCALLGSTRSAIAGEKAGRSASPGSIGRRRDCPRFRGGRRVSRQPTVLCQRPLYINRRTRRSAPARPSGPLPEAEPAYGPGRAVDPECSA